MSTSTPCRLGTSTPLTLAAVVLPVMLTACDPDTQSLIDPASLLSPVSVQTTTDPEQPAPPTGTPVTPPAPPEDPVTPVTPPAPPQVTPPGPTTPPTPPPVNGDMPQDLAYLFGRLVTFSARFNVGNSAIVDEVSFANADFDFTDGGSPYISTIDTFGPVICAYVDTTGQLLCLRGFDFDLNERIWHLFRMGSSVRGDGIFEYCEPEISRDECSDKLLSDPDGEVEITVSAAAANASVSSPAPYFSYAEQGTLERADAYPALTSEYAEAVKVINSVVDAQ